MASFSLTFQVASCQGYWWVESRVARADSLFLSAKTEHLLSVDCAGEMLDTPIFLHKPLFVDGMAPGMEEPEMIRTPGDRLLRHCLSNFNRIWALMAPHRILLIAVMIRYLFYPKEGREYLLLSRDLGKDNRARRAFSWIRDY